MIDELLVKNKVSQGAFPKSLGGESSLDIGFCNKQASSPVHLYGNKSGKETAIRLLLRQIEI